LLAAGVADLVWVVEAEPLISDFFVMANVMSPKVLI
jgi:hypothetical protein